MTSRQQLIYNLVAAVRTHPTAEEVLASVRKSQPGIGLATVYRTLNLLAEEGLIRRIPVNGAPDRFDGTLAEHEHVICRRCGRVRDIFLGDIVPGIISAAGGSEVTCQLNIWETCPQCMQNK